jgi:hypothetical protein
MVFLLTLLGSMIVCEALFCGDLRRVLATTRRDVPRWHASAWAMIAASGYYEMGGDYRWE